MSRAAIENQDPEQVLGALTAWTVAVVQFNATVAARMEVTETGLQCLYELSRNGPSTPGELGLRVGLTSGAASRMVERLHAAGHVRRVADPHDRRRVLVEPMPASLDRIASYYAPLTDRLGRHLSGLGAAQLATLGTFATTALGETGRAIQDLDASAG